ncbi:o-succinylbenzoate synthase [Chloroflexia bacterium SDU3-3]|nr:o-succinylbenzoate synthase [Chloroflexia bacterium SDU3-3]
MIIQRILLRTYRIPYQATFTTAHGSEQWREGVLLEIDMGDGLTGLGEAAPVAAFGGGSAAQALAVARAIAARALGQPLALADRLLAALDYSRPGVSAAACAFDTAIHDIRARQAKLPLAHLLTPEAPASVTVNATIGGLPSEAACESARQAVGLGFGTIKLKVGVAASPQGEIERIKAVRAAIGPDVKLRLDANGAWDAPTAIAILHTFAPYNIELLEQPVPADDLWGMAQVRAASVVPIAADEALTGPEQARQIIQRQAADILVVKPMCAGGIGRAREIAQIGLEAGLGVFVTSTIESGVGVAAALHVAAALPTHALACGLATGALLAGNLLRHALPVRMGRMALPAEHGLGVALDDVQLGRWASPWQEAERI